MNFSTGFCAGLLAVVSLSFLAAGTTESAAAVDKRVALVIGNSAYKNVTKLPNPASDATAIAALLKKSGFDVIESRQDLSINDMRRAVRDFSDKTRDADIAVVFYAGHGIEVDGTNYLVPIDAQLDRDIDVEDEALPLDRIIKIMEPVRRLRLVILDACRDNPFMKSMKRTISSRSIGRGLGKVEVQTSDTLIAFAAKAGSTASDGDGRNSPFTAALLNNLATPGLDLRLAFGRVRDEVLRSTGSKQEPFVYGSLGGTTVALVAPLPEPVIAAPAPAQIPAQAPAGNLQNDMRRDYEFASQIGTKDAWDQFLSAYNTGLYAGLARAARAKILAEEAKVTAESNAAVAKAEADAKAAAANSQAEAKAAIAKAQAEAKAAIAKAEADIKAAAKADTEAKAAAAKANIVVATATPAVPVEAAKPAIDPSQTIRQLQSELRRVGCYPGAVNGEWSPESRKAMELFNKHAGMRLDVKLASLDVLDVVKGKSTRICPLECERGFKADKESCVKITCPAGQSVGSDNTCEKPKEKSRSVSRPEPSRAADDRAAAPKASGGGQVVCGRNGCVEVKAGCRAAAVSQNNVSQNSVATVICN